jgi:hypothetical protein
VICETQPLNCGENVEGVNFTDRPGSEGVKAPDRLTFPLNGPMDEIVRVTSALEA